MYHHITMMLCWIAIPFSYFICAYVWMFVNVVTRARVHAYCVYKREYVCAQIMKVPVAASITVCVLIPNRSCITARVLPPVKREDNIIWFFWYVIRIFYAGMRVPQQPFQIRYGAQLCSNISCDIAIYYIAQCSPDSAFSDRILFHHLCGKVQCA